MLSREALSAACLSYKGAALDFPFGPDTWVFKVAGKLFALMPATGDLSINLKCDPVYGEVLRASYAAITPGYHMDKRHWVTVVVDGSVPDEELLDLIGQSYALVVKGLTKAQRAALEG